jgi:hypothetical protein
MSALVGIPDSSRTLRHFRNVPTRDSLVSLLLFEICIAQAIDLYSGKSRGQREQRDGLQPVMRWSAEQRIADRGGDEYAVLLAPQELFVPQS